MTLHKTATVNGLYVFYREAGDPANPKLLLLGGFPASSHQFRNLIPALATGSTSSRPTTPASATPTCPTRPNCNTPSTTSSDSRRRAPRQTSDSPAGLFMQDYGGPIGNRILGRHPEWLEWLILQNANTYEEGFTARVGRDRGALWVDRSPETEAPLPGFPRARRRQERLHHGHPARADQPRQLEHRPASGSPARAPRAARPALRLPDQRRALSAWQKSLRNGSPRP